MVLRFANGLCCQPLHCASRGCDDEERIVKLCSVPDPLKSLPHGGNKKAAPASRRAAFRCDRRLPSSVALNQAAERWKTSRLSAATHLRLNVSRQIISTWSARRFARGLPINSHSFDDLVGAAKQCQRYLEAKRLGGLQIDDHFDSCGLLHGQVFRFFILEYGLRSCQPCGKNPCCCHRSL